LRKRFQSLFDGVCTAGTLYIVDQYFRFHLLDLKSLFILFPLIP
jgi:hypothetical protein